MKKLKKGFTLLELVIVIAVIAVLAAILIPTFAGMIKRSRLSTDIMACKNLNTTAAAIQISDDEAPQTMTQVIDAMVENGYKFDNLKTANSDNVFVYDSINNRFFVYDYVNNKINFKDESTTVNLTDASTKVNYWIVSSTYAQTNENLKGFSVYLKDGYTGPQTLDITTGLDVGANTNIEQINYTNTTLQTVTIRTNGGNLTINAKNDDVKHYGYAETVRIVDVATASYHENGEVKFMEVSAGHIVIEEIADVSAFHFSATGEGENAKFENNEGKKISVDLSKVNEDKMPTFSRDAVVIEENGTYVAEVKTESTEYIWLFGQGIKEQMVVTDKNETIAENGVLKQNVETGAEDGSVAEQIANPAKRNAEGQLVDNDNNVVTVENAIVEEVPSKEDVQTGATLFDGGTGTELDPFVIVDYDTMQHITTLSNKLIRAKVVVDSIGTDYDYNYYASFYGSYHAEFSGYATYDEYFETEWLPYKSYFDNPETLPTATYNFKVKDGITVIDCNQNNRTWVPVALLGNFDGNGVIFNNVDKGLFRSANGEEVIIKNFTINANISVSGGIGAVVYDSDTCNLTIDSVDVHGSIIGASWVTPYVQFGPGPSYAWNLTIKNSVSDATLVATSGTASGFVGHPYDDVSNGSVNGASLITIIDSAYIGNMSATGSLTGTNFKYFTINGNDNRIKTLYSEEFIEKLSFNPEGTLYGVPADKSGYPVVVNEDGSKVFFCGNSGKNVVDNYKIAENKANLNTTARSSLPANIGDVFTITKISGASKAVISLQIAPNDKNNYGSYLGTYLSETIDISSVAVNSTFTSEQVKYFTININSDVTTSTGVSGNIFNVVNSYYGKNAHNGATVKIVQYDTNGNVLNITSLQIADRHAAE